MKRFIYNIVPLMLVLALLQSCKKVTTAGFTEVTIYPVLTLNGEETIFVKAGSPYEDPGVTAVLGDDDVTEDVVIKSNVNTAKPGLYTVSYRMTNVDGFFAEKSRVVYVYDATPSVLESRIYTVLDGSHRVSASATTPYSGYPVVVNQVSPGVFTISDFLGGYYQYRAGYGVDYAASGEFVLDSEDGTLELVSSYVPGWGDELSGLEDGVFDATTGTISFSAKYAGMSFNVILK